MNIDSCIDAEQTEFHKRLVQAFRRIGLSSPSLPLPRYKVWSVWVAVCMAVDPQHPLQELDDYYVKNENYINDLLETAWKNQQFKDVGMWCSVFLICILPDLVIYSSQSFQLEDTISNMFSSS